MRWLLFYCLLSLSQLSWAQERIIALSPAINEILFAVGAGEQVVANTEYSNYPLESKDKVKVGGYFRPNLEKILTLSPTLVIMHDHDPVLVERLNTLHIPTITVGMGSLEELLFSIQRIGTQVGKIQKTQRLVKQMQQKMSAIQQRFKKTGLKILVVFGMQTGFDKGVFVSGKRLYFNDIIELVGCENAFTDDHLNQPILTKEGILATQADIVIILSHDSVEQGVSIKQVRQPWETLAIPAAMNQQIHVIDKDYAAIPSHRVMRLIDDFANIVEKIKK